MTAPVSLRFAHGGAMPALGFGTGAMTGGMSAEAVATALKTGYRHIDTARYFPNHQG
jgi:2,5-diketo-D-gluconate reductase A